ncbi:hypothetical protein DDZ13_13505 [Coraliomargarita sinensis]|uniref:Uncharacterized protein n=1 Tax=Coraliomargarita sinensis TaxID=2174842 RepID=A0A317ZI82_9BACT|nr:hypothetical protein [Coraliomargarita sinensis]PXA03081.1 hypothetical protein DDZ13_13505 [Coraliomargarita sinensis]
MELTDSQKSAVVEWVQEARSIADIQRLLLDEFKISMTYMDVRFLVDDLDVPMVEPETEEGDSSAEAAKPAADAELVDEGGASAGGVSVDVDAVMRPGSLVSGTANFSDGKSLGWQLSASGQLGLIPDEDDPEYRPAAADLEQFQSQLQEVLQQKGF